MTKTARAPSKSKPSAGSGLGVDRSRAPRCAPPNTRPKRQTANRALSPTSGEDLTPLLLNDGDDSDPPSPGHQRRESCAAQSTDPATSEPDVGPATVVLALEDAAPDDSVIGSSRSSTAAHDIDFFFNRGNKNIPDSKTVCRLCWEHAEAYPRDRMPNYKYGTLTSNSTLRIHLENHHEDIYVSTCEENGWKMMLAKRRQREAEVASTLSPITEGTQEPVRLEFSYTEFLDRLVKFVVVDDQSLNIIECPEFRNLLLSLRPQLQDSDIPHRTKLRELIFKALRRHLLTLKDDIGASIGKISFTADIWSSGNRTSYLAMTAHWIARNKFGLHFRAALIAFDRIYGKHDGENLADITRDLLDKMGITTKVGHWTLDNAGNNKTFMQHLEAKLLKREIAFHHEKNRIMCFPHIINICTQHMIADFSSSAVTEEDDKLMEVNEDFPVAPQVPQEQTYEEAYARDPLSLGRNIVRLIRSSGQHSEEFQRWITMCNNQGLFGTAEGKTIRVPERELLHNVRTRWDSVYLMLLRLLLLRPAIDHYLQHGPHNHTMKKYSLTPMEWTVLTDFKDLLSIPHRVQQAMSGEQYPTLSGAIPAFEMYMTELETVIEEDPRPQVRRWAEISLTWAKKYYCRMDLTDAYIIAMFINPSIRFEWIEKHWDNTYQEDAKSKIIKLMKEYQARLANKTPESPKTNARMSSREHHDIVGTVADRFNLKAKMGLEYGVKPGDQGIQEEFDAYTKSRLTPPDSTTSLKFWETHAHVHPMIYAIAMDYLPIQASAVPCERIFSSSSDTDTEKRNRISPELLGALQLIKNGIKQDRLSFMEKWVTSVATMEPPPSQYLNGSLLRLYQLTAAGSEQAAEDLIKLLAPELAACTVTK